MPLLIDTHPTLSTLSDDLDFSGQWAAWAEADPRIGSIGSLEDARHLRGAQAREAVAALVERACRRGGDDDTAALAVLALLDAGATSLYRDVADLCEPDDVMTTLFERIKAATPVQGSSAAHFLLKRTKEELIREHRRGRGDNTGTTYLVPVEDLTEITVEDPDSPLEDLVDLLDWARSTGALRDDDVDLLLELVTTAQAPVAEGSCEATRYGYGAVQRQVAASRGLSQRQIVRRRSEAVSRLRAASGEYVAQTC